MMMYPPYSVQALQWKQCLSTTRSESKASSQIGDSASLRAAQDQLRQALQEKEWLLVENQHLGVPPTHLDDFEGRHIFSMGDFVKRADEARDRDIQVCSVDENGERRLLTPEQLKHLKQTGELEVTSELFENQHHIWKVAPGFYSGTQTVSHSCGEAFGNALNHYVVYTSDAIVKEDQNPFHPTFRNAFVNGFTRAGKKLREAAGQLFVGRLRHRTYSDSRINEIMQHAERGYIYYHLRDHDTRCLFSYFTPEIYESTWDVLEKEDAEFATKYRPSPQDYDEKEHEFRQQIGSIQRDFEERMQRKRRAQLNVDNAKAINNPQMALVDFKRAEAEWRKTKDEAWLHHLRSIADEELQELGRLEADRLLAIQVEKEVEREDEEQIEEQLNAFEAVLKKKHRVLYLSKAWRRHKLDKKRLQIEASLQSTHLERVTQRLDEQGLESQITARKLAIEFRRDLREPLVQQLRSRTSSFPPAPFKVLQLDPNNWTFHGGGSINRYKKVEVDLGKPLWRLHYTWTMAVSLAKRMVGGAFHFLVSGPLSLRALFSPRPYYAMERPVRDCFTQTLFSRLQSFYAALKAARDRFDASPDTGLIGKSIQSFFLRIYLALRGVFGTLVIVTFMTLGTLVATAASLVVLTLAPVLAAVISVVVALFNLIVYDTAMARARSRVSCCDTEMPSCVSPLVKIAVGVPYYLIIPGAIQAVLAAVRVGIVHPIAGTVILSVASLRYVMRSLRDSLTWFFISKYSRIPASDTFLASRIHGPGLAPIEYYRLPLDAAKAGVLLMLDKYRLQAHAEVRRNELDAPYARYSALFTQLVDPFGVSVSLEEPSPSSIASSIAWKTRSRQGEHLSSVPKADRLPFDIWDMVADGIRASHPDFEGAQKRQWEATEIMSESFSDENIDSALDRECLELKSFRNTELGEIVSRAGKVLAEWNLKMRERDRRLTVAASIPISAQGRFRMSEAEQQELWKFTLSAVELYGQQLNAEMQEVLETSEFSEEIRETVMDVTDSFYTHSGARPGQDIPVVAAFLLQKLLGGFDMLETLEATDETLVLSPKMSKEDEHLVFWKSVSECIGDDQQWEMPWTEP